MMNGNHKMYTLATEPDGLRVQWFPTRKAQGVIGTILQNPNVLNFSKTCVNHPKDRLAAQQECSVKQNGPRIAQYN